MVTQKFIEIFHCSHYRDNRMQCMKLIFARKFTVTIVCLVQRYIFFNFIQRGGGQKIGTAVAIWGRKWVLGTIFDNIDKI